MAIQRMVLDVEMEDGTVHTGIKTNIADQMLYSRKSKMEKWGSVSDDPLTFLNFMAFAALSRLGLYPKGWNEFINDAAAVGDSGSEDISPTTAAH